MQSLVRSGEQFHARTVDSGGIDSEFSAQAQLREGLSVHILFGDQYPLGHERGVACLEFLVRFNLTADEGYDGISLIAGAYDQKMVSLMQHCVPVRKAFCAVVKYP